MKFNKYISAGVLAALLGSGLSSCSDDFLKEELTTDYSTQYFETAEGIQSLTLSLYGHLRWWGGYENQGYYQTMGGTDEFGIGTDAANEMWLTYDPRLAPTTVTVNGNTATTAAVWDELYYGIAAANMIISKADKVGDEKVRNLCLAQAYLLRGFNFYMLTSQYGRCVLQLKPAEGVVRNFEVKTPQQCWEQIIEDLRTAYGLFEGENYTYGKGISWTKATAAHFLAKALLFAASERNSDWNAGVKEAYLKEALEAANYAIGARKLEANVTNLYGDWTGINCAIEKSDEILMAATQDDQFKGRTTLRNPGAFFNPQFSNFASFSLGSMRGCPTGGKDFQRFRPTEYTYSAFDIKNDARLFKSFATVYGTAVEYTFKTNNEFEANAAAQVGPKTVIGDVSTVFIFNKPTDHTYDKFEFGAARYQKSNFVDEKGRLAEGGRVQEAEGQTKLTGKSHPVLNSWIMYKNGKYVGNDFGSTNTAAYGAHGANMFAGVSKHTCGYLNAYAGDNGSRDVILARLGETYLVRAEIKVRLNDYDGAKADIDALRKRGAWHQGENRAYYVDGCYASASVCPKVTEKAANITANEGWNLGCNTYYLSNPDVAVTYNSTEAEMTSWTWDKLPAEDETILAKLGVTNKFDRALHFILNEQTRELVGEFVRWEHLTRTNTLGLRAKKLNPDVLHFQEGKHNLRPIPQSFIDNLLREDGNNLTEEEEAAWQNPGY